MKTLVSAARGGNLRFRGSTSLRAVACWTLTAQLAALPMVSAEKDKSAATSAAAIVADPVLKAMQNEIARATAELSKAEQPPYYLSYTVYDQDFVVLVGAYGRIRIDRNVPVTARELAVLAGLSTRQIYALAKAGELHTFKEGGVPAADAKRWLSGRGVRGFRPATFTTETAREILLRHGYLDECPVHEIWFDNGTLPVEREDLPPVLTDLHLAGFARDDAECIRLIKDVTADLGEHCELCAKNADS